MFRKKTSAFSRLCLEQLEAREVLASHVYSSLTPAGQLIVEGTDGNDQINVWRRVDSAFGALGDQVLVQVSDLEIKPDGTVTTKNITRTDLYLTRQVKGIFVNGLAGADQIAIDVPGVESVVYGGEGDDLIEVRHGNNLLFGGNANVNLNDGNDTISGGDGNDVIFGGGGNDRLHGLGGNNMLFSNRGTDTLFRGPDKTTFIPSSDPFIMMNELGVSGGDFNKHIQVWPAGEDSPNYKVGLSDVTVGGLHETVVSNASHTSGAVASVRFADGKGGFSGDVKPGTINGLNLCAAGITTCGSSALLVPNNGVGAVQVRSGSTLLLGRDGQVEIPDGAELVAPGAGGNLVAPGAGGTLIGTFQGGRILGKGGGNILSIPDGTLILAKVTGGLIGKATGNVIAEIRGGQVVSRGAGVVASIGGASFRAPIEGVFRTFTGVEKFNTFNGLIQLPGTKTIVGDPRIVGSGLVDASLVGSQNKDVPPDGQHNENLIPETGTPKGALAGALKDAKGALVKVLVEKLVNGKTQYEYVAVVAGKPVPRRVSFLMPMKKDSAGKTLTLKELHEGTRTFWEYRA